MARKASSDRLECPTVRMVSGIAFQDNPAGSGCDPEMKKGDKVKPLSPFILILAPRPFEATAQAAETSCAAGRPGRWLLGGAVPSAGPLRPRRGRGRSAPWSAGAACWAGLRRLFRSRGLIRLAAARHGGQDDETAAQPATSFLECVMVWFTFLHASWVG